MLHTHIYINIYVYICIYIIYKEGAKKRIHLRKEKKTIKTVILNLKDEYKSHLTSAMTRGAQSGYHQRLDTSD